MKKTFAYSFVLCAMLLVMFATAALANGEETLILPSNIKTVKEAAFYGVAAEKVVIPEGTKEICSKAFANCNLKEISLPASLQYIADDAFLNSEIGNIIVPEDCFAYEWADERGYITGQIMEIVFETPDKWKRIDVIESFQIPYHTVPRNASEKVCWQNMDPDIGYIDENGLVTPLKAGDMWIQVRGSDGRFLGEFQIVIVGEKFRSDCLEYAITSDGNGYKVVGCNGEPERIAIPAVHEGLPVVGFEPGAFKNCTKLTDISLEEGHSKLYMENDALYADLPEKTLLCYPGSHLIEKHYYIASGTKAIAAYAIANSWLRDLTIPEGVISIGDRAFYRLQTELSIYIPDSLSEFGNYLFQSQQSNAAFYVNTWEAPAAEYAKQNNIPCGVIVQTTPEPTVAPTPTPVPTLKPDIPPLNNDGKIVVYDQLQVTNYELCLFDCNYDISTLEGDDVDEVRLAIEHQWEDLPYISELSQQTGLYGAGHTEKKAVLRAYDKHGRQIDAKEIYGNFIFDFDGASALGVSGGRNTKMKVLPIKPIFITAPGKYPIQPSQWHDYFDGNLFQFYIIAMPRGNVVCEFPQHLNIFQRRTEYCSDGANTHNNSTHIDPREEYTMCAFKTMDGLRANQINQAAMVFDTLDSIFSNEKIAVYVSSMYHKSANLGEKIYSVYDVTLTETLANHYPSSKTINRITVYIDGSYPGADDGAVWLNDSFCEYDESDACAISHEIIHAIDQNIRDWGYFDPIPSSWYEGRAEYISKAVCSKLNVPYTSNQYGDGKDYNWNFVSEIDRKDFFEFYYHSTNRYTTYPVGYYFYDFLIDTYGSDVGARVMNNLATLPYDTSDEPGFFKHCVEAATEIGVFQRFVDDVIIPSGT